MTPMVTGVPCSNQTWQWKIMVFPKGKSANSEEETPQGLSYSKTKSKHHLMLQVPIKYGPMYEHSARKNKTKQNMLALWHFKSLFFRHRKTRIVKRTSSRQVGQTTELHSLLHFSSLLGQREEGSSYVQIQLRGILRV